MLYAVAWIIFIALILLAFHIVAVPLVAFAVAVYMLCYVSPDPHQVRQAVHRMQVCPARKFGRPRRGASGTELYRKNMHRGLGAIILTDSRAYYRRTTGWKAAFSRDSLYICRGIFWAITSAESRTRRCNNSRLDFRPIGIGL